MDGGLARLGNVVRTFCSVSSNRTPGFGFGMLTAHVLTRSFGGTISRKFPCLSLIRNGMVVSVFDYYKLHPHMVSLIIPAMSLSKVNKKPCSLNAP